MRDDATAPGRPAGTEAPLPAIAYEREPGAAAAPLPPSFARGYKRRQPELTALHAIVRDNLETFLAEGRRASSDGSGYPRFVEQEFRKYLACGDLSRGFVRLRCPSCETDRIVSFSCKGRVCPSCWSRRAADLAADFVDRVLPVVPYRQFVLSFPWSLRFPLAMERGFFTKMLNAFLNAVFSWQRQRGRRLGVKNGHTGAISFLQRATGALTLFPHIHSIIPDGLFVKGEDPQGALRFVVLPSPTDDEIVALTTRVVRRLIKVAKKYRAERGEEDPFDEPADQLLRACATEALRSPTPAPPQTVASRVANKPLTARLEDFSLHAGRFVPAFNRAELEALCRYGLRPPFSTERFSLLDDGMVRYELPKPTASGHTELRLSPLALLRRLTAILPAPFVRLVRSHGVFSARSCFRQRLPRPTNDGVPELLTPDGRPLLASDLATPPPAPEPNAKEAAPPAAEPEYPAPAPPPSLPPRRKALWAQLLCRVLQVDALECPKCAASMVVVAFISDPAVVTKILRHLQLATTPAPLGPAREPEDAYDGMAQDVPGDDDAQASPPDGDASRGRGS